MSPPAPGEGRLNHASQEQWVRLETSHLPSGGVLQETQLSLTIAQRDHSPRAAGARVAWAGTWGERPAFWKSLLRLSSRVLSVWASPPAGGKDAEMFSGKHFTSREIISSICSETSLRLPRGKAQALRSPSGHETQLSRCWVCC